MSLLPSFIENDEELLEENRQEQTEPKEYEINFITGQLTGNIVTGLAAIKMWVYMALLTARYRYTIYSWDYGCELEELISLNYNKDQIESEAQRMIRECLEQNEFITGITNFNTTFKHSKLTCQFTIQTQYGNFSQEVEQNV